jgi:hypothetical protein
MSNETDAQWGDHSADAPNDHPAVASPGDSDAPDAPDSETVYPDEQGVPGDPADE